MSSYDEMFDKGMVSLALTSSNNLVRPGMWPKSTSTMRQYTSFEGQSFNEPHQASYHSDFMLKRAHPGLAWRATAHPTAYKYHAAVAQGRAKKAAFAHYTTAAARRGATARRDATAIPGCNSSAIPNLGRCSVDAAGNVTDYGSLYHCQMHKETACGGSDPTCANCIDSLCSATSCSTGGPSSGASPTWQGCVDGACSTYSGWYHGCSEHPEEQCGACNAGASTNACVTYAQSKPAPPQAAAQARRMMYGHHNPRAAVSDARKWNWADGKA